MCVYAYIYMCVCACVCITSYNIIHIHNYSNRVTLMPFNITTVSKTPNVQGSFLSCFASSQLMNYSCMFLSVIDGVLAARINAARPGHRTPFINEISRIHPLEPWPGCLTNRPADRHGGTVRQRHTGKQWWTRVSKGKLSETSWPLKSKTCMPNLRMFAVRLSVASG
jgi:hypothetical protein